MNDEGVAAGDLILLLSTVLSEVLPPPMHEILVVGWLKDSWEWDLIFSSMIGALLPLPIYESHVGG